MHLRSKEAVSVNCFLSCNALTTATPYTHTSAYVGDGAIERAEGHSCKAPHLQDASIAYVSVRQRTSAYVSIRQHASAMPR